MRRYTVTIDDRTYTIDVDETTSDSFEVSVDGRTYEATLRGEHDLPGVAISPMVPTHEAHPEWATGTPAALAPAGPSAASSSAPAAAPPAPAPPVTVPTRRPRPARAGSGLLAAPMPGVIVDVHVAPGAAVCRGDPILVLEAMKMRNTIRAPRDGFVLEVAVEAGRHVASGDPMVRLGDAPG